jgi:hypothetical protein
MPYEATLFPNLSASKKYYRKLSIESISEPKLWPDKKSMPLLAMAAFGEDKTERNSYRFDANVTESYGNALDYDNNDGLDFSFHKAMGILNEYDIVARGYTSPSHTEEHPRWRLLIPYSKPYKGTTEEMKRHHMAGVKAIEELLGVTFAPESSRLSQSYYIGQAATADSYEWEESEGDTFIDNYEDLVASGFLLSGNGHDSSDEKLDANIAIDDIGLGEDLHDNILRLTAHYAKYSLPRQEIIKLVQNYLDDSDAPHDDRYQKRYDSIGRLTDGALRKLASGEWDKLDPQGKPVKNKKGKKVTLDMLSSRYRVTTDDLAEINTTSFIYKEIFRGPQMIAIAGPPSAGKTTVMEHIAADMSDTHTIIYVNADISSGDVPEAHRRALAGGYELWCPDIKIGKSMNDVVEDITALADQGADLTGYIFVFDTLKKMTDMINKAVSKDLYKMLRSLTAVCHATVICLAHCNKYDHDGWPQYEGTVDLRSDFDALGLLYPLKGDYNQITTALYWGQDDDLPWGKTRGRVDHAAWSMDVDDDGVRTVEEVRWIDTYLLAKDAAGAMKIEDVSKAIANCICNEEGIKQIDLLRKSGHPERITRKVLKSGGGKFWEIRVGEHGANHHFLTKGGKELIDVHSAKDDFEELLQ